MDKEDLKKRLKKFALRVMNLADKMPKSLSGMAIAKQIVRSGTSPYANYCASCLAKSDKDFINKLKMVEEELDETLHWMELIQEGELVKAELLVDLYNENLELLKIIVSSIVTTKNKINRIIN